MFLWLKAKNEIIPADDFKYRQKQTHSELKLQKPRCCNTAVRNDI